MITAIEIEEKLNQLRTKWKAETNSTRRLIIEKQAKALKNALQKIGSKDIFEQAKEIFNEKI